MFRIRRFGNTSADLIRAMKQARGFFRTYTLRAIYACIVFSQILCPSLVFAQFQSSVAEAPALEVRHFAGDPGGPGFTDGARAMARLNTPTGIWGDANAIYVAESQNRAVRSIDPITYEVSTFAQLPSPGCTATSIRAFFTALSIVGDESNLYVADACVHVIFRISRSDGNVAVLAGTLGRIGSADGDGPDAQFSGLTGIWSNAEDLFVADSSLVRRISKATASVSTLKIGFATGIWGNGDFVYLTFGTMVRRVALTTGESQTLADLSSDPSNPTSLGSIWGNASALYFANGNLVQKLDLTNNSVSILAGIAGIGGPPDWHDGRGAEARFAGRLALWGDGAYLYVAESGNHTVRGIALLSADVTTVAGRPGINGYVDGAAGDARFSSPSGLWGDANYLYVADGTFNNVIRRIAFGTGEVSTLAGAPLSVTPINQAATVDGIGLTARFNGPWALWGDGANLYVLENPGFTIRKISLATLEITTVAGQAGVPGSSDGIGSQATFGGGASGLWGDGTYLYIADGGNGCIRRMDLSTYEVTTIAGSASRRGSADGTGINAQFVLPSSIWGDGFRYLYISEVSGGLIRRLDLTNYEVKTIAGMAFQTGTMDGSGSVARFIAPVSIWGDGRRLYIADNMARNVRALDLRTGNTTTVAGSSTPSFTLGIPDHAGVDDGIGTRAAFMRPSAVWGNGAELYVSDTYGIRKLTPPVDSNTPAITSIRPDAATAGSAIVMTIQGLNFSADATVWTGDSRATVDSLEVTSASSISITVRIANDISPGPLTFRVLHAGTTSNAIAIQVGSPPDLSERAFSLPSNGGAFSSTSAMPGAATVGYARIVPSRGSAAPAGSAVFTYRQNGILISEAAVPSAGLMRSGRIYMEANGSVNTGIAIANPNDVSTRIDYVFNDPSGAQFFLGSFTLAAHAQLARFLTEYPFFLGNPPLLGAMTFTSVEPVTVIALRGFVNERSEFLMTTLPVTDLSAPVSNAPLIFPQIAVGAGWTSDIILVNPSDGPESGILQFFGTGEVNLDGRSGTQFSYRVNGKTSQRFRVTAEGVFVHTGFVRAAPDPGQSSPSGIVVFRLVQGGITTTEAGVLAQTVSQAARIYVRNSIRTGFAIANPANSAVPVRFELFTLDGQSSPYSGPITIAANAHAAMFVDEVRGFENLPRNFEGVLRISTSAASGLGVMAVSGTVNERGDFIMSTAQPASEAAPSNAEMFFPHFVESGGFTTSFFLFDAAGTAASGTLQFFGQAGQSISLP